MNPAKRLYRRALHAIDRRSLPMVGEAQAIAHPFDAEHGVDTGGYIPGETLSDDLYSTDYYGIAPSALALALDHLAAAGIDPRRFTFVDLGCGKARAMLVASRLPFERIIGIELSGELCAAARANVQSFQPQWLVVSSFDILHADATAYAFPETPLVVFLYHPFLGPTLRQVLHRLARSVREHPREVYLLYANPTYDAIMAEFPFLAQLWFYKLPLSPEDAAADRHGITHETFALYRHDPRK